MVIASGETITALVNDSSANDGGTEIVLDSQSGTVKEGMIVTGGGVVGKTFVTGKVGQAVGGQFGGAENVGIKSLGDFDYFGEFIMLLFGD